MTDTATPPRCTQCNPRKKENARNLVACIDGTSSLLGLHNTNVMKLFRKVDLETNAPEQRAYYSSGVGTHGKLSHITDHLAVCAKIEIAVGWNLGKIVKDVYFWLAHTYREGDHIYLFGFCRGAYQVRMLAAMIHEVGLTKMATERQIRSAYDHYEAIRSGKFETRQIAKEFKDKFSWKDLRVHFVGVWDTVSTVGLLRGDVFLSMSSSATHACHFRHALALDERRVKYMPEYFHEMNTPSTDSGSKYVPSSDNNGDGKEKKSEIKEVWFAGCHPDLGGGDDFRKSHQAGNVSLLWMRREAAACGLRLKPTDIVWVPDDLDFGTLNSMTHIWRVIEYFPIRHQVSFSGSGEDALRSHRAQPRRIIPGQKVHASILYANLYNPTAIYGEGFDIPIVEAGLDNAELDNNFWETGFFDDTAAQEIVTHLVGRQEVAPAYLDGLLFMLRFSEGKQCIRNVLSWQEQFMKLIEGGHCAPLVRLVVIVAFHEVSCDLETHPNKCEPFPERLPRDLFVEAESSLKAIFATHKHRDGPRALALLRPLTKHPILRRHILTNQVLETLMTLLDAIVKQPTRSFGKAMDGLSCLLQCEDTQSFLIKKLGETPKGFRVSRLAKILEADDPGPLIAALRMMLTLSQIPDARPVCYPMLPRIVYFASASDQLVGPTAVEILLALDYPTERRPLNIRNARVRANLAGVLVRRCGSPNDPGRPADPGQEILSRLFGLYSIKLSDNQKWLIGELKTAVEKGNTRERTTATLTLLKLCETEAIRSHLRSINLLELFIKQLQRKDSALLAAYALMTCLKYTDMEWSIRDNDDLPTCIVAMLAFDYFDDAIGQVEGFQIFGDLMQHADLWEKIKNYKITEILDMKLGEGRPKEIRTSIICLEIFQSFDPNGPWVDALVGSSLERLMDPVWKVQKAGVAILSALIQTERGVAAIWPRIHEIVEMLLPGDHVFSVTEARLTSANPNFIDNGRSSPMAPSRLDSRMLGPVCALRVLVKNETLRIRVRETVQYASLKQLFLSGTLVNDVRADMIKRLDELIKVVDGELSEGLMLFGDPVLPHNAHWHGLVSMFSTRSVEVLAFLPIGLGVLVLAILDVVVITPIHASVQAFKRLRSRYQDRRASGNGIRSEHTHEVGPESHQVAVNIKSVNV